MALLVLPVAIGMLILLQSKTEVDVKMAILLVIWFAATIYAALKGVRFTLLMVAAFGVALGITFSRIQDSLSGLLHKSMKINRTISRTLVVIALLLILLGTVKAGNYTAKHFIPSVNDAWYDSLTNIKDNSEPDAIINSWWDFGHWFKYIADRRVTLDGSSQAGAPLHWLGKLMATNDERHSVGILRMLDCGSNKAFDALNEVLDDTPKSIGVIDELVTLDREDATMLLMENGLDSEEAEKVLQNTHCNPPENFFITSEDMVGKAGVWSHFGTWNFARAEMYINVQGTDPAEGKKFLMDPKYNLTEEQADNLYYEIQTADENTWITDWPNYISSVQGCQPATAEGIIACDIAAATGQTIPIRINMSDSDVNIMGSEAKPASLVILTENGTEEITFTGKLLGISVVLIPSSGGYSAMLSHPTLANSMFTRLFYLEGHGLEYFDRFDDRRGVTGGRIIVWKVDWEGTNRSIYYKSSADVEQTEETDTEKDDEDAPETDIEDEEAIEDAEDTAEEDVPEEDVEGSEDGTDKEKTDVVEKDIEIDFSEEDA
jgi:dolichyl-diphosphooligosaccharide--protein glycosyltransferase